MTRRLIAGVVAALALATPASAQELPPEILKVYEDWGADSQISACRHTVAELQKTKAAIPPDIDQYAPDFPGLVDAALEAHARGECAGKKPEPAPAAPRAPIVPSPTPVPTAIPTKTVVSEPPQPVAAVAATGSRTPGPPRPDAALRQVADADPANNTPAPVWMLGLGAAVLALAGLFFLVAARTRRGGEWVADLRHSWGEAAWRAGGTWTDFADWVRVGR